MFFVYNDEKKVLDKLAKVWYNFGPRTSVWAGNLINRQLAQILSQIFVQLDELTFSQNYDIITL